MEAMRKYMASKTSKVITEDIVEKAIKHIFGILKKSRVDSLDIDHKALKADIENLSDNAKALIAKYSVEKYGRG